jgi:hypothetical protein
MGLESGAIGTAEGVGQLFRRLLDVLGQCDAGEFETTVESVLSARGGSC